MSVDEAMFFGMATMILVFSVLTVTTRKILHAAVFLLFVLVATAGLYFILHYNYLAAVQLLVYAGGIVVLIIFSILLTSKINEKMERIDFWKGFVAAVIVIAGATFCIWEIYEFHFPVTTLEAKNTDIHTIGISLLSTGAGGYALPFEVISLLLLASMIAAIIIAKKEKI